MNGRKKSQRNAQVKKKHKPRMKVQMAAGTYSTYKDRVFRMLFKDKGRLLELYNAINGTDYTASGDLEVNILDNAIFIKIRNDVSFVIDGNICLYEH